MPARGLGPLEPDGRELDVAGMFGATTFARGRAYARSGAVLRRDVDESGDRISGEVAGGAPFPYLVTVRVRRGRSGAVAGVEAECTCPVGWNCKHAVALLLSGEAAVRSQLVLFSPADPAGGPAPGVIPAAGAGAPAAREVGGRRAGAGRARRGPDATEPARRDGRRAPAAKSAPPAQEPGTSARVVAPPAWVSALAPITAGSPRPLESANVALQVELVAERRGARSRPDPQGPGIRLRPVLLSPAGNWVRTGASWTRLSSLRYGRTPVRQDRIEVLEELWMLAGLGQGYGFAHYGEEAVWLESVGSRRVWDVLRQAVEIGIPLVAASKQGGPIRIEERPVEFSIDLRAEPTTGLSALPTLSWRDGALPAGSLLLIGCGPRGRSPYGAGGRSGAAAPGGGAPPAAALAGAHGVAWWDGQLHAGVTPPLCLAPLGRSVGAHALRLVQEGPLAIPAGEVDEFVSRSLPVLRRHITVTSRDSSFELPDLGEDRVVCTVRHLPGPAVELEWTLRAEGEVGGGRALTEHPSERASAALAALGGLLRFTPGLVGATAPGQALPVPARLAGLEAARFVSEVLPAAAQLEGVEVCQLGEAPEYHEVFEAPVVSFAGRPSDGDDWFDLSAEVTVGGEEVPFLSLFLALAEGRSHLVLPSGTYFALDRPELVQLAALIEEARSLSDSPPGTLRLTRFQASLWDDLSRLGNLGPEAERWSAGLRRLAGGDHGERPLPEGLTATLRPYQLHGFQWLAARYEHGLGGILADDMGLGKTVQVLALMLHARQRLGVKEPFLVVAPTSVVGNWAAEAARFAPGLASVTVGETCKRSGTALAELAGDAAIVVTSYALLRLEPEQYEQVAWAGLVLDEAQFAKNTASHTYARARRLHAPWKLAVTGTPLENSLAELWALTSITAPGLFPRLDRFEDGYRRPIERERDGARLEQLRRRIRPIMLRRTKEQVAADLPEKQEQVLELDLDTRHRRLYRTYLQRERQKVLGLIGDMKSNRFEILRSLTLLRQAALDVGLVDAKHRSVPSAKLDVLADMVAAIATDGHRVLVFSQFTRFLGSARERLEEAGIECCYLDGRTRKRAEEVERFRSGDAPAFLISLKAGGFGLNLVEADYCVLLDPWWNPATEAQAVDRVHRIGQTRRVMVYRLVARETIEEKVMALKERKAKLFESVVGGGGFESAALSAADVRDLLR